MSKPFRFKQFDIHQDRCAMKVGTDGVLLGAWIDLPTDPKSILDIGTGTGLIALMMAQRTIHSKIDAIEIEAEAASQAKSNVIKSQFSNRINVSNTSIQDFQANKQYDLILSNPPFYTINKRMEDGNRQNARQGSTLDFPTLLKRTNELLAAHGKAAFILPFDREKEFKKQIHTQNLYVARITRVKGNPQSPIKRSIFLLQKAKTEEINDSLVLEIERHKYTQEYHSLVKDFYLNL